MEADTSLEVSALEELDFEIPCGHGSHDTNRGNHSAGNAEFVALVTHSCSARPDLHGSQYPCCAGWAAKVTAQQDQWWTCPACRDTLPGSEMVVILGPLNKT